MRLVCKEIKEREKVVIGGHSFGLFWGSLEAAAKHIG